MKEYEQERESVEEELQRLRPAKLPVNLVARLSAARPHARARPPIRAALPSAALGCRWWRWLAPATAAVCAAAFWWLAQNRESAEDIGASSAGSATPLRADEVAIDRELVGFFDAVATLPDGEPVRVRFRGWMDEVVLRDTAQGVAIHQRTPRIEVVPVSFETY